MKDRYITALTITWIVAALVCLILGTVAEKKHNEQKVRRLAREMMEREAVIAGHAEWKPGTNGEPVFHWKSSQEAKP